MHTNQIICARQGSIHHRFALLQSDVVVAVYRFFYTSFEYARSMGNLHAADSLLFKLCHSPVAPHCSNVFRYTSGATVAEWPLYLSLFFVLQCVEIVYLPWCKSYVLEFQIAKGQNGYHKDWWSGSSGHEESLFLSTDWANRTVWLTRDRIQATEGHKNQNERWVVQL